MSQGEAQRSVRVGLIGSGIAASLTPAMHMREGAAHGLDYDYQLLDLDHVPGGAEALPSLLERAEAEGFAGLNITHPCKQTVIPLLHELSEDARALGAVNTVVLCDGRRHGHNTDWWGFAEAFRRGLGREPSRRVLQLGAGGAGSAVAYALLRSGVERLEIFEVMTERGEELVERLGRIFGRERIAVAADKAAAAAAADGVVNTTPVGMAKYPGTAVAPELLSPRQWVAEIIYFPLETELLRRARARGCRTLDGGGMAVFQAVRAFELFTGLQPDAERMLQHFKTLIVERDRPAARAS